MARLSFTFAHSWTPASTPLTLFQIVAPSDQRPVITNLEISPRGSTGASVPLLFDWTVQSNAGGLVDGSGDIVKLPPLPGESGVPRTTIRKRTDVVGAQAEPASVAGLVGVYKFSLHEMGARPWVPPNLWREQVISGATRWGFRYVGAGALGYLVDTLITLEE